MPVKFSPVGCECSSKEWISGKYNNDECDYWLVLSVLDMRRAAGSDFEEGKDRNYHAHISVVVPSMLNEKQKRALLFDYYDDEVEMNDALPEGETELAFTVYEHGPHAPVWQSADDSSLVLMHRAVKQAENIVSMFGFYMDNTLNMAGATGWDFIRGNYCPWRAVA